MTTWINIPEAEGTNFGYYNMDKIIAIAVNNAPSPSAQYAVYAFTTPVELADAPALAEPQIWYLYDTQAEAQAQADAIAKATGAVISVST